MELKFRFPRPRLRQELCGEFQNVSQSLMGIWYMEAVSSTANVIDQVQHGIGSGSVKEFAVMSVIAVVSSYRAVDSLVEYLDSEPSTASYAAGDTQQPAAL